MKQKKKECRTCGDVTYMFTRRYGCRSCSQQQKSNQKKIVDRAKGIKKVSKKQARSNRAVTLAKLRVLNDWIREHGYVFCSSCGTRDGRIDMSHLIPIGYNKELEGVHTNIKPQCDKCHPIQEAGSSKMKNFVNYNEIMEIIKYLDKNYYNKLKAKHDE